MLKSIQETWKRHRYGMIAGAVILLALLIWVLVKF